MFSKNSPASGGSFYLQSKFWCAKEELLKDFPGAEKEYYEKNGIEDPTSGKKAEKTEEATPKKEEAKEENKEKNTP